MTIARVTMNTHTAPLPLLLPYPPPRSVPVNRVDVFRRRWVRGLGTGDLNVAHEDKDFYNAENRATRKAAGTTPEERSSFAENLLGRAPPDSCASTDGNPAATATAVVSARSPGANADAVDSSRCGLRLVDTFRKMHPKKTGVFSYWSVRAGNRPVNRGMRLDYCLASPRLVNGDFANGDVGCVHDAFVLDQDTVGVSDHCPVGVVIRLGDHHGE